MDFVDVEAMIIIGEVSSSRKCLYIFVLEMLISRHREMFSFLNVTPSLFWRRDLIDACMNPRS